MFGRGRTATKTPDSLTLLLLLRAAVAPGVKLIGLDVFDGDGASWAILARAVNWVVSNKDKYSISAINMSLGGDSFTGACARRLA